MMSHRGAVFSLVTVLLWLPELRMLLMKSAPPTVALVRMGVAVVVAWAAVAFVSNLIAGYLASNRHGAGRDSKPDS